MNDLHSGIPLEADDSDSSDLGPFEADEKDVKREERNFHVPLQAGLPWFTTVYLVLGCTWGVSMGDYGCIILTFAFRLVFGLGDLTLGLTKKQQFFAKWFWCFRPQVVKIRKTPLPLPWVGKV